MATTIKPWNPTKTLIVLQGEYDLARREDLRSQLGPGTALNLVLLDMRDVTFLDATALGEIVSLRRRMASPAVVRIIGATPHIRKIFDLTGVSTVFEMHDSFASACEGFLSVAPSR
jgi:anti-anti-sigma factor